MRLPGRGNSAAGEPDQSSRLSDPVSYVLDLPGGDHRVVMVVAPDCSVRLDLLARGRTLSHAEQRLPLETVDRLAETLGTARFREAPASSGEPAPEGLTREIEWGETTWTVHAARGERPPEVLEPLVTDLDEIVQGLWPRRSASPWRRWTGTAS